jgi:hypothetical protein
MPIYRVEIHKHSEVNAWTGSWLNAYHVDTVDQSTALGLVSLIIAAEQAIHGDGIAFDYGAVIPPTGTGNQSRVDVAGTHGDRTVTADTLPFWNVVDVVFNTVSGQRVNRKFYRAQLSEGDVEGYLIADALVATMQAVIDTLISDVFSLCAPNGDSWQSGTVQSRIGMRQLLWHRRARPGFHRAYVPNA